MTGVKLEAWNPYKFTNANEVVTMLVLLMLVTVLASMTLAPIPRRRRMVIGPLLLFWVFTILSATFFGRLENRNRGQAMQLELFWTVKKAWEGHDGLHWYYIIGNILLFVPLGFLLPLAGRRMQRWLPVTMIGAGLSLMIELTQYVTGTGLCELDDLFHNTWGTFTGYQVFLISRYLTEMVAASLAGKKYTGQRRRGEGLLPFLYLLGVCLLFTLLLYINRPDWTGIFY